MDNYIKILTEHKVILFLVTSDLERNGKMWSWEKWQEDFWLKKVLKYICFKDLKGFKILYLVDIKRKRSKKIWISNNRLFYYI